MEQDWLISSLKFIRLNLGIILVSVGLFAALIWGGTAFIQNFPSNQDNQIADQGQISATATVVPTAAPDIETATTSGTLADLPQTPPVATQAPTKPRVTPSPTPTPILTQLPTPTPTVTPKPSATPTPVLTVKPTTTPTPTAVPTPTPTSIPTPTPTVKPTPTSTVAPTPTPTPQPVAPTLPEQSITKGGIPTNNPALSTVYTVKKGDSTWKIAQQLYGDGYRYVEIEKANNLTHNQWLTVGQVLTIPDKQNVSTTPSPTQAVTKGGLPTTVTTPDAAPQTPVSTPSMGSSYEVKAGDTLWSIAQTQLQDPYAWTKVYQANKQTIGANPGLIYPGQKLSIPAKNTTPTSQK